MHVVDPERSIQFYQRLGFELDASLECGGQVLWASLRSGDSRIVLAHADAPIDPDRQAVRFLLQTEDVATLRAELLEHGIAVGPMTYSDHRPEGEIRLNDPDGYVLLIGALST